MKRLISWLLSIVMLLCLSSCDEAGKSSDNDIIAAKLLATPDYPQKISFDDFDTKRDLRESNPVSKDTVRAINQFSYDTAAQVFAEIEKNGCYSPLSLYFALALAANGAGGTTRDELLALLGTGNTSDLTEQCGNLYRLLYTDNEISKLKIANSLWLNNEMGGQKVTFKDRFLKNAVADFYASIYTANFADESAGKAMSEWISENTNGKITPKIEVDIEQIMCILNTVYFYDEWIDRFNVNNTKADTFYLENGNNVTCKFMNLTYGSHSFCKGNGYIRSSLELKGGGSMVFILPDKSISVSKLLASTQKIEEIFIQGNYKNGEVIWSVPKFEYGSSLALKDTLKSLGIAAAFSKQDADFSGITDSMAFISDVTQETHISIDENGVEAAAYTKIDYTGAAMPKDKAEMILNRPFIYGITASNGTLLFVGVCRDAATRGFK